ncbi:MAG: amidohydrolase family protein [Planctomycetes bacterium]|nr:amidohydrolase family protein [Planctomycetota bacterium]
MTRASRLLAALAGLALATPLSAQNARPPQPVVLTNVRLSRDAEAPPRTLVLANGRIAAVLGEGAELPAGVRVVDGAGALALPAFVDAFTTRGLEAPEAPTDLDRDSSVEANVHIDMREANRKGIRPAFHVADALTLADEDLAGWRAQGFGVVHVAPSGELLGGSTAVVSLREAALRDRVLAAEVYLAASLRSRGWGYPGTLMACHAQLRQFFLDARRQRLLLARYAEGRADRRPPYDRDFAAIDPVLDGAQRLLCHADSENDLRRWLKLAAELDVPITFSGGAEAWRVASELAAADVPVLLELDWPDEAADPDAKKEESGGKGRKAAEPESEGAAPSTPEEPATGEPPAHGEDMPAQEPESAPAAEPAGDAKAAKDTDEYEEPLGVRRERRRRWLELRDCALRLHEAGVTFGLGSGDVPPKKLVERVRTLVEAGLPEDVALAALTSRAAELVGLAGHVGRLEPGMDADIALWSASPFQKKATLQRLFVDGAEYEFEAAAAPAGAPDEGVQLSGTWSLTYEAQEGAPAKLVLVMDEAGAVTGTLSFTPPDGSEVSATLEGTVSGADFSLQTQLDLEGFAAEMRIEGTLSGDEMSGDATWKYSGGEETQAFRGTRVQDPQELLR